MQGYIIIDVLLVARNSASFRLLYYEYIPPQCGIFSLMVPGFGKQPVYYSPMSSKYKLEIPIPSNCHISLDHLVALNFRFHVLPVLHT